MEESATRLRDAEDRIERLEIERVRAETLFAVAQILARTLTLEETFETILSQLDRVVPYDSSSIQVVQGGLRVIVGGRGFEEPEKILGLAFDLDDETDPSFEVFRSRRPRVIGDVSRLRHFARLGSRRRAHPWLDLRPADLQ